MTTLPMHSTLQLANLIRGKSAVTGGIGNDDPDHPFDMGVVQSVNAAAGTCYVFINGSTTATADVMCLSSAAVYVGAKVLLLKMQTSWIVLGVFGPVINPGYAQGATDLGTNPANTWAIWGLLSLPNPQRRVNTWCEVSGFFRNFTAACICQLQAAISIDNGANWSFSEIVWGTTVQGTGGVFVNRVPISIEFELPQVTPTDIVLLQVRGQSDNVNGVFESGFMRVGQDPS